MSRTEKIRHSALAKILIVVFLTCFVGNAAFIHSHKIGGEWITHAHPYLPSPTGHSHSAESLATISLLSNFIATQPSDAPSPVVYWVRLTVMLCTLCAAVTLPQRWTFSLRAPPELCF